MEEKLSFEAWLTGFHGNMPAAGKGIFTRNDMKQSFAAGRELGRREGMEALELMYWYYVASGVLVKPEWVKNHPAWPVNGKVYKLHCLVQTTLIRAEANSEEGK